MSLDKLRDKIDEIDTAFLALLALRFEQSKKMKDAKKSMGMPVEDKEREDIIRRKWRRQAEVLGVNEEFAVTLLDLVLMESKRLQSH